MSSMLPLHEELNYASVRWHDSKVMPGVRYATRRMSLAQRIDLTSRVLELTRRHEFLKAGDASDRLEASLADLLTRRLYLEWGLAEIGNLTIDGEPATVPLAIERAPESLANEVIAALEAEVALSEEERKNF